MKKFFKLLARVFGLVVTVWFIKNEVKQFKKAYEVVKQQQEQQKQQQQEQQEQEQEQE